MCNCTSENPYSLSWLWIPGLRLTAPPQMRNCAWGDDKWSHWEVGQREACPPFKNNSEMDGGHGASAPLPTLRTFFPHHIPCRNQAAAGDQDRGDRDIRHCVG